MLLSEQAFTRRHYAQHSIELWVKTTVTVLHPNRNFGDVLPSQSLGVVLNKLYLTQQKQRAQKQNSFS